MRTARHARWHHYRPAILSGSRQSGAVSAAWAPTDLGASLAAWYDANDLATLWQDSARTTPVAADADPVGAIDDKSGNARHLLQAVAGSRATYKTGVVGAKHALRFDGTADHLTASVSGWPEVAPVYVAMVLMASVSGGNLRAFGSFTVGKGWTCGQNNLLGEFTTLSVANNDSSVDMFVAGTPLYMSAYFDTAFDVTFRKNGSQLGSVVLGSADANAGVTEIAMGANPGAGFLWDGDIAEVFVLGRAPTAGEITSAESYFATKYGI